MSNSSSSSSAFPTIPRPCFLSLVLFALLTCGALGSGSHFITVPPAFRYLRALAWDPTAQHFLVGSSFSPAVVSSVSDAGVIEPLVSDPLLPVQSSVAALTVDDRRRILLVALTNPAALSAYDLRSPRPHRRIFLSLLPQSSAVPGAMTVDHASGAAFVTAGSVVVKVDLNGAGRVFRKDDEVGAAKEVALASAAEEITVRADGAAMNSEQYGAINFKHHHRHKPLNWFLVSLIIILCVMILILMICIIYTMYNRICCCCNTLEEEAGEEIEMTTV